MKSDIRKSMKIFVLMFLMLIIFNIRITNAQAENRVVIVSGQEAPGTGGAIFSSFSPVAISDTGRILFEGQLQLGI